jgi:hypothetical protein
MYNKVKYNIYQSILKYGGKCVYIKPTNEEKNK